MRLLVLGGTAFVGRATVEAAVALGWHVTTFNRGQSGLDVEGVEAVHGDRYDPGAVARLGRRERWDAVVDCSGYVPRNVLDVARRLAPSVSRYIFMSTVSVYADWPIKPLSEDSPVLPCPPDAGPDYGTDTEDDGRLFVGERNREHLPARTMTRVWSRARRAALSAAASPLARVPYDLRHAAVSTWLNAGVPATTVAAWAGHSGRQIDAGRSDGISSRDRGLEAPSLGHGAIDRLGAAPNRLSARPVV